VTSCHYIVVNIFINPFTYSDVFECSTCMVMLTTFDGYEMSPAGSSNSSIFIGLQML